ncbi:MAG: DUF3313 domain-containing protein [Planctomycetes bacterium]|nr:DUF3313 domain-containing protein [Planctomycetota bacterium]
MKITSLLMALVIIVLAMQYGCGPKGPQVTGFLSNYSRLEAISDTSLRYINPKNTLGNYSKFIIDPVDVHFHSKVKDTDISSKELAELRQYMYAAIHNAVLDHYNVVRQPGSGVAKIRIALTDIEQSSPVLNAIPHTMLVGAGLGGASMEAEVVDSVTGEQIAAVVQSQKGKKLSLEGLSKWGNAKAVMDGWAQSFTERLDEARIR